MSHILYDYGVLVQQHLWPAVKKDGRPAVEATCFAALAAEAYDTGTCCAAACMLCKFPKT